MADAAASALAVEAYKDGRSLVSYVSQKISYANDLKSNYEKMKVEAEKLYARRDDLKAEINKERTQQIKRECEVWFDRVTIAENEVLEFEDKYAKRKRGGITSYLSRSNLSKRLDKMCDTLYHLRGEGKFETGFVADGLPEPVRTIHAPSTVNIPSLHCVVEEVLSLLRDKRINKIGIWGLVGTGKTTIMQNLNDDENIAKMFDIVIWITVSNEWSIDKLQKVILKRLKLNTIGVIDSEETAWRISKELECKRYLLLLDEVWSDIDLHALGIRNNQKDGKVVIATRYRDVCYYMDTDEHINVKRLSEIDGWKMFEEKVGRNINLPGIKPIAQQVANECAGLPLLLDKVAKIFKKKDNIHLWRDGLKSLRRWPSIKIQGMDEVLEFLKFCYEELEGEDKKICFLYSALYPEGYDIFIDYLLECWRAHGFIEDADKFRDARDKGYTILHDLVNVSLLENSEKHRHIRMNKVLRNMALKISSRSKDSRYLVRSQDDIKSRATDDEWKQANRISFIGNKLDILPENPDCGYLSTLLLQKNFGLTLIPPNFFALMQKLQVLDMHGAGITFLPQSLSCLKCLKALYLNSCINLSELPDNLKDLTHLEVLDIRGSGINYFPIQLKGLVRLKCLRMSLLKSRHGTPMPTFHKVISSLTLLEELSIDVDPYNQFWDENVKAVITEVAALTQLTTLSFCFPDVESLGLFITKSTLWKDFRFEFQFSVGYHDKTRYNILNYFEYQISRCFRFVNGIGVIEAVSEVLAETDAFELIGHKGVSRMSDFGIQNINRVRGCLIERCNDIETIIDGNGINNGILESLEKIYINNALKLKSIWEGPVPTGSLSQLTAIILRKCAQLKKVFSSGVIQQLSKLQQLMIEECHDIEEIITEADNIALQQDVLPDLKIMTLTDLPKLNSIWISNSLVWPSLEQIKILNCPLLTKLPFDDNNAMELRCIEGEQSWWDTIVWQDNLVERRLRAISVLS